MPSVDKFQLSIPGGYNFYPVHDSLCLLDAHLVFEPLLSSLGVMPQQMISNVGGSSNNAVFDTWGSSVSLVASMEAMKIDIVVSECGKPLDRRRGKKGKFSSMVNLSKPNPFPFVNRCNSNCFCFQMENLSWNSLPKFRLLFARG